MKRVIVDHYGGPEVLKVVEAEVPRPGQGEGGMYGEAQDLHHMSQGAEATLPVKDRRRTTARNPPGRIRRKKDR